MKKNKLILFSALILTSTLIFTSCNDKDDTNILVPNALVTVKPLDNGNEFYLQLDENTAVKPVNVTKSPYGNKQVRALINYEDVKDASVTSVYKPIVLNYMDSIRTKGMVPNLGEVDNLKEYGNDPLDIVNDWITVVEDGYLTIRFRTFWGYTSITHTLDLVYGTNPKDPYEVVLHHNNHGDFNERVADGIIAFDLSQLPDTNGDYVNLKVKWNSIAHRGYKTAIFKYKTRAN